MADSDNGKGKSIGNTEFWKQKILVSLINWMSVSWFLQKVLTGFLKRDQKTPAGNTSPLMNPDSDQHWVVWCPRRRLGKTLCQCGRREEERETRAGGCGDRQIIGRTTAFIPRKLKRTFRQEKHDRPWALVNIGRLMTLTSTWTEVELLLKAATKIHLEVMVAQNYHVRGSEKWTIWMCFMWSEWIEHADGWVCSLREGAVEDSPLKSLFKAIGITVSSPKKQRIRLGRQGPEGQI